METINYYFAFVLCVCVYYDISRFCFVSDSVFIPHILPPKVSLTLKSLLLHQKWRDTYELKANDSDLNSDVTSLVNEQLSLIDP